MNPRQLQYAVLLAQTGNVSQVAQQLGITQPALSKQILRLEEELGVRLFDRDRSPMALTPAGEVFIREAEDLLYREDQLLRSMEQFRSGKAGRLTIGISPFRSLYLMPDIARKIRAKHPGVQVCLREQPSDILRQSAAEGRYDFAVVNLPVDDSLLEVIPLEPDQLVLAVPNGLLHTLSHVPDGHLAPLDLADCSTLPFVVVGKNQEMRQMFQRLCARTQTHPPIAMEVVGVATSMAMANAGIGAALLPLQFIGEGNLGDKVTLFTIRDNTFVRQPAVVYRRGQHLSEAAAYAIDLLTGKA